MSRSDESSMAGYPGVLQRVNTASIKPWPSTKTLEVCMPRAGEGGMVL